MASVFANRVKESFELRFCPMIPDPTTVQKRKAVPKNSEKYLDFISVNYFSSKDSGSVSIYSLISSALFDNNPIEPLRMHLVQPIPLPSLGDPKSTVYHLTICREDRTGFVSMPTNGNHHIKLCINKVANIF